MSPYDVFVEGISRILLENGDFFYRDDQQTLDYIRVRIKRTVKAMDQGVTIHL